MRHSWLATDLEQWSKPVATFPISPPAAILHEPGAQDRRFLGSDAAAGDVGPLILPAVLWFFMIRQMQKRPHGPPGQPAIGGSPGPLTGNAVLEGPSPG